MTEPKVKLIEYFNEHWYKLELESGEVVYYPSTTTKLSVTAKPFLAHWRGDIGNREADLRMQEAADRGSRLHHAWSVLCQGGAVIYQNPKRPAYSWEEIESLRVEYLDLLAILQNQEEQVQIWKLSRWLEALKPTRIISEQIVYSHANQRAGTCDNFLAVEEGEYPINGKAPLKLEKGLYIADLKTGKVVDDDAFLQTSDYAHMLVEMAYSGVDWASALIKEFGEPKGSLIIHTSAQTRSGISGLATLLRTKDEMAQDYEDMQYVAKIWDRKNKDAKPTIFEFPSLITMKKEPATI